MQKDIKNDTLLELKDYSISFRTPEGEVKAVSNMNLTVKRGERIAIVGESGSGKSQTFLGIMGLLAKNGRTSGQALLEGRDVLALKPRELDHVRGKDMAMVFQDPMTALNPSLKISRQLTEQLEVHRGFTARAASAEALDMLKRVGIPDPSRRFNLYPHELSGGMRQRIVIAMALLTKPKLLIADEPTTALDVTIQAQILDLFNDLTAEMNTALVMITHDLGVVAGLADRVAVMYAGRIVEEAPVDELFENPAHPYTAALHASIPRPDQDVDQLAVIPGRPPNLQHLPKGCSFSPRCPLVQNDCIDAAPRLDVQAPRHLAACFHAFPRLEEVLTNG
ncbi:MULTISPECIES: ABC transporter ATP-binding protein [unclassified Rhizobium]|jgi:oligopeptide transport system ATP-binding protein|uniref:ABC transporter ATP-binding protein n=1 Tax=unclassified Rhizobium TaxID=2613769 RepID=UPI000647464A|nr:MULTISPECIES: ABC transporter ATP-binding protein [unclassified Rhizobium]MBO9122297.1 ABC transporter ATP-binding protein [Rhizobium sp. 16-488-2b]MBO9172633.1 ABC transporter ATP-binding protein [Rhizobium sp. 16-488-2a]MDM9646842.1 ABC transporter ATP-binding protein [Rhizobium sp. S163]